MLLINFLRKASIIDPVVENSFLLMLFLFKVVLGVSSSLSTSFFNFIYQLSVLINNFHYGALWGALGFQNIIRGLGLIVFGLIVLKIYLDNRKGKLRISQLDLELTINQNKSLIFNNQTLVHQKHLTETIMRLQQRIQFIDNQIAPLESDGKFDDLGFVQKIQSVKYLIEIISFQVNKYLPFNNQTNK